MLGKTEICWIPGNHDTDRPEYWERLVQSELADRNLHGKVVTIDQTRIGALGGVFRGEVWHPDVMGGRPPYESYAEYASALRSRRRQAVPSPAAAADLLEESREGKLRKHQSTIFHQEYVALAGQRLDILVTHEAPSCHRYGFAAIDSLARAGGAHTVIHGHHHDDYEANGLGFRTVGVGLRGLVDENGVRWEKAWRT